MFPHSLLHIEYDGSELDELVLAYATTIHKSQGSEYPVVVMPVLMEHYTFLSNKCSHTVFWIFSNETGYSSLSFIRFMVYPLSAMEGTAF